MSTPPFQAFTRILTPGGGYTIKKIMKSFSYFTSNSFVYVASVFMIVMLTQCETVPEQKKQHTEDVNNTSVVKPRVEKGVSLINLISNPEKFNGKSIRVEGFLIVSFESTILYFHKEDYDYGLYQNGIWIEISKDDIASSKFGNLNKRYVLLEGTFDATNNGHFGKYVGGVERITRAEVLARR